MEYLKTFFFKCSSIINVFTVEIKLYEKLKLRIEYCTKSPKAISKQPTDNYYSNASVSQLYCTYNDRLKKQECEVLKTFFTGLKTFLQT